MKQNNKKKYSGVFRDGDAGQQAKKRFRNRRVQLMKRENKLMVLTGVPMALEKKQDGHTLTVRLTKNRLSCI